MIVGTNGMHALGAIGQELTGAAKAATKESAGTIKESFRQQVGQINGVTIKAGDASEGVSQLRIGILRGTAAVGEPTEHKLFEALQARGVDVQYIEAPLTAVRGEQLLHDGVPLQQFDAVIPRYAKKEGSPALDWLRDHGTPVLNDTEAISTTQSKARTEDVLAANDVARIPTYWATKASDADAALAKIDGDICVKPFDGESGHGVEFFTNRADAKAHIERHFAGDDTMLSVQPKVDGAKVAWQHPELGDVQSGMDYRVLVTRDRFDQPYVDTILQRIGVAGSDKSNLDGGGWGRIVDPTREQVPAGIAETALKAFNSVPGRYEVGGVDVIPVGRDSAQAITNHRAADFWTTELNSSPGFPDQNYGSKFTEAIADRAVILAQRSQAGQFA